MVRAAFQPTVAVFSGGGTGGHLYPALALADALAGLRPDLRTFFLGATQGVEATILPERGYEYHLLPVRGFRRGRILENLGVLWVLLRSLVMTGELFASLRPGLVVVTGGYASGPAGLAAGIMGIPLALQEQNARPGFTARVLSRWSRQIHLAFPEAKDQLPLRARPRARLSGNPVRPVVSVDPGEARTRFGVEPGARVILVVGGSQGSAAINAAVTQLVRGLSKGELTRPENVVLLWATGPEHYGRIHQELDALGSPPWVRILSYIQDMPGALAASDLAVSRAGAMTTAELLAWGVPAVLVPLPSAAADHQSRNAESLVEAGAALHLPERDLSGPVLWQALEPLLADSATLGAMRASALAASRPQATTEIAEALAELLPSADHELEGGAP